MELSEEQFKFVKNALDNGKSLLIQKEDFEIKIVRLEFVEFASIHDHVDYFTRYRKGYKLIYHTLHSSNKEFIDEELLSYVLNQVFEMCPYEFWKI